MSMKKLLIILLVFSCLFSFQLPEGKYELNEQGIDYSLYVPPKIGEEMILVLHDTGEKTSKYVDFWYETAKANNYLILAPSAQNNMEWVKDDEESVFRILEIIKKDYGTNKVYLNGFSEGSHYALYLLMNNSDKFLALCSFPGVVINSLSSEVVPLVNAPPFLFVHGILEEEVPVKLARWDVQKFREKGFNVVYWETEKTEQKKVKQDIIEWFEEIISQ